MKIVMKIVLNYLHNYLLISSTLKTFSSLTRSMYTALRLLFILPTLRPRTARGHGQLLSLRTSAVHHRLLVRGLPAPAGRGSAGRRRRLCERLPRLLCHLRRRRLRRRRLRRRQGAIIRRRRRLAARVGDAGDGLQHERGAEGLVRREGVRVA